MKKQLSRITFALAFCSALSAVSQEKQVQPCNTYAAMEEHFANDPQARIRFEAAQKQFLETQASSLNSAAKPAATEFTVPVVFHVLYQCGSPSVSDADCISALAQVNKDFARESSDTGLIFAPFKSLYIDSDIKFMLAKKDPAGNCTNGIVRHEDAKTKWSQGAASASSYWPYTWDPSKYLNIYIVTDIVPQGTVTGGGIIVGYTYIPGTWPTGNPHDAIVYRYNYLTGGGSQPNSRSLTHEIGHWLGLPHTFGSTNNPGVSCGDDGVSDTPITKGNFGGCPVSTTNQTITCSTSITNYFRNVENIMNYSDCPRNFTAGQTNVMRNVLASSVSNRQNLSQPSNLNFTDINNTGICVPIADFHTNTCSFTLCAGQSLTFKDFSYNSPTGTVQWAADNGATIVAPTSTQTAINFPNMGVSSVTLTVTNSQGSSTKVKTVTILDPTPAITGPMMESFESPGLPPDWQLLDVENDGKTWELTQQVSYDQSQCYYIDGSQMLPGRQDHLITPLYDLKNNPGAKFEFAYAYRRQTSSQDDQLKIQGSKDCGGTWEDIVSLSAQSMALNSGGVGNFPFFPNPNEWKIYSVSSHPKWNSFVNFSSVKFRFNFVEGSNGYGNNIFIDAVNFIQGPVGVNELTRSISLQVYPNPATEEAFVSFTLNDESDVKISIMDIVGKEVKVITDRKFAAGDQTISLENQDLASGAYLVNITLNGTTMSRKLIKE